MLTDRGILASDTLSAREIARLVGAASEEGRIDNQRRHRAYPRYRAGMRFELTNEPAVPDSQWPVTLHDISDGGFALWSKREVPTNINIWVREFSAETVTPWIAAHVTSCSSGILGFLVGAEFHVQPPLAELKPVAHPKSR